MKLILSIAMLLASCAATAPEVPEEMYTVTRDALFKAVKQAFDKGYQNGWDTCTKAQEKEI